MKKILISIMLVIGWFSAINVNKVYANDTNANLDSFLWSITATADSKWTATADISWTGSFTKDSKIFNSTDSKVWKRAKGVLETITDLFYRGFYEDSIKDFFWNIPWIWNTVKQSSFVWWVSFIMALITFFAYLFVDRSSNTMINKYLWWFGWSNWGWMGMDWMGMQDPMMWWGWMGMDWMGMDWWMWWNQEKDLWNLIKTNFLLAMNDKIKSSDKIMIWWFIVYIIISLLLIATFVNTAFAHLLQPAKETISYLIYNIFVIILGIWLIFLAKVIYIDGLIGAYMNQKSEPSLKPAIVTLFAYAIIVIVVYSSLYALQWALFN